MPGSPELPGTGMCELALALARLYSNACEGWARGGGAVAGDSEFGAKFGGIIAGNGGHCCAKLGWPPKGGGG
jgi:hypothetical protein